MPNRVREIVVVEDNADDADLARLALQRTGVPHHLTVCPDGTGAIAHLYSASIRAEPPALVLLDLKLPRVDGKTVLRELRGNPLTTRVPVVALTSSRLEQDLVDAYCLGANSYFVKPVDFREFLEATTVLATYWLGLNLSPPAFRTMWPTEGMSIGAAAAAFTNVGRPRVASEVVIVDANREDLRQTGDALHSLPIRTRVLAGFDEVVEFLRGAGGPPPLIDKSFPQLFVVDVDLDQGDGRDVLQALRYRGDHHALVVMFTRNIDPAFVSECYRVKVSGVVQKPDTPAAYREAVRLLAFYWMYLNEPPPDPIWSTRAIAHPG